MSPVQMALAKVLRAWLYWPEPHGALDSDECAMAEIGSALVERGLATHEGGVTADGATLLETQDANEQRISCGHSVADLIGGTDPATGRKLVTKCGACLAERTVAPPYEQPPSAAALLAKAEEHESRARACRAQAAAIVGGS